MLLLRKKSGTTISQLQRILIFALESKGPVCPGPQNFPHQLANLRGAGRSAELGRNFAALFLFARNWLRGLGRVLHLATALRAGSLTEKFQELFLVNRLDIQQALCDQVELLALVAQYLSCTRGAFIDQL